MEVTDKTPHVAYRGSGQIASRKQITAEEIDIVLNVFQTRLSNRLQQKGRGTFASRHELKGIIDEEIEELHLAVRSESMERVFDELGDLAVGAVFGMACIAAKKLDW